MTSPSAARTDAPPPLTLRQRWTWMAHFYKAVAKQHHRPFATRIAALLPKDGIVIDVGAHSGQFAKLFAHLVPQGHVYAFEPGSYALSILTRVAAIRGLRNLTVIPLGLSDSATTNVLHVPLKKTGSLGFGLSHIGGTVAGPTRSEEVHLTTLDDFATQQNLTRVDFLKADIEGWELHMLQGGRTTIRKFRPTMYLEISEKHLARAGASPQQMFAELDGLSYAVFRLNEMEGYRIWSVAGFEGTGDYLFVPQEKASLVALV